MDREIINDVLEAVARVSREKVDDVLRTVWQTGLKNKKDEDIELAFKYFCEFKEDSFMPTPAGFMSYIKYDDQHGHKAAQKRKEETQELIKRIRE